MLQVTIGEKSCTGRGLNKKSAKQDAAKKMLKEMGYQ
jgi:dsRNA-specific ribonuclease